MYDVIIAGGGPAGLSAAIYARRAAMSTVVLEGKHWGGAIVDARRVDNYPGTFGISGYELAESFRTQALELGAELRTIPASGLQEKSGYKKLSLNDGSSISGKTVIIATGTKRTPLDVSGSDLSGVSYCASCDGAFFKDQPVCVVGGGDTAVDAALLLSGICSKVYLIHRRKEFRAAQNSLIKLGKCSNSVIITDARVRKIYGDEKVSSVVLEDTNSDNTRELAVNGVFVSIGSRPNTEWLPDRIKRDAGGYIKVSKQGTSTWPGVFAAGDVRSNTFRQVVTAAADGANCVKAADEYLRILQ